MKNVVALLMTVGIFSIGFAQPGELRGDTAKFINQVVGDLGWITEACTSEELNLFRDYDGVLCAELEKDVNDSRRDWDSWASIRGIQYRVQISQAWRRMPSGLLTITYRIGASTVIVFMSPPQKRLQIIQKGP